jgi:signal transduction histidine kinase
MEVPETAASGLETRYRHRRLAGLFVVLALLVLLVNAGQWIQHSRLRARLDQELSERLLAVAGVTALSIDGEMVQRWRTWGVDPDEEEALSRPLIAVADGGAVSSVYLLDPGGGNILDLGRVLAFGEQNPVVTLDPVEFALAASGLASTTPLRAVDAGYLKAVYVPIESDDGDVVGVLAVEGGSELFQVLRDVRNTMIVVALGSVGVAALLGLVLARLSGSLARAEQNLRRAETLTTMGRMAAGIAHEVRNPLGIIRASAERLVRRVQGDPPGEELGKSIVEEVDRLNGIVSGYLDFASDRTARRSRIDLVDVVRGTVRLVAPELGSLEVTESIGVASAPIEGDSAQLRQVFLNVILNAVQAMPDGGALEIELGGDGDGYRVRVRDSGVGIAATRIREVWRPFHTSKTDGSGLGLAIARRIIDAHHGSIAIESTPGAGTTVTIELPASVAPEPIRVARSGGGAPES